MSRAQIWRKLLRSKPVVEAPAPKKAPAKAKSKPKAEKTPAKKAKKDNK